MNHIDTGTTKTAAGTRSPLWCTRLLDAGSCSFTHPTVRDNHYSFAPKIHAVMLYCWAIHNATIVQLGANDGPVCIRSVVMSPPHFEWATTRMRLRASLHFVFSTLLCFLNERCESHHSPGNFVYSSTGRSVFPILTVGGFWARDRRAVKCMTLHLWAANLKPFLVAHSFMAFTACCKCLSMLSRERPWKQTARSSTKSALKMSLAIKLINLQSKTCHSQNTFLWVEFVRESCPDSDSDSPILEIFWYKNTQSASDANPAKVTDDTILPGCLICFLQVKEETNCLLPLGKCIPEISFKTHQVVVGAPMFPEATLASV